jgi:ketosteroid isomerase-like protein
VSWADSETLALHGKQAVRRIYESWARGDFRAGNELYDRHVILVLRPEFPEAGPHYGRDAIRKYMKEDFLLDFPDATISAHELLDAGESVIVRVEQSATGPRSGVPVQMRYYQVWTFRGSSVIRIESIMDRGDALEAAGLRD